MNSISRLSLLMCLGTLAACSGLGGSKGEPFVELEPNSQHQSILYIYRVSSFVMSLAYPDIFLNDQEVESVRNGSYVAFKLEPGEYNIRIDGNAYWYMPDMETTIDLQPGSRKFLRVSAAVDQMVNAGPMVVPLLAGHVWEVPEALAVEELKSLKGGTFVPEFQEGHPGKEREDEAER